ncbi:Vacuolar ATPase assembly integral membrane protein VPH2 [Wickerhamomyces ciferrii]|uniref:Vacuolar ATPase assembly integral membrane protein VPH2 n=1 Tax=Wickerhamomyces ciferrii (strain ATCC 14091 / BCRC 22168 / CBS 111 / JCM 3599 / NBRC 0793 / NRRL Y-1031 F-60-10) TaxID=1206466 RepID=K0KS66_WICCF|nr:Vacuolar ATPase assembly integral membrane protein VPH2 [Wickerhamomyces ciferrii]CCH46006.1 Vacuolar ATPase assembly integral membrane protein VPH2 [Wickerhamomyces ciferrii]
MTKFQIPKYLKDHIKDIPHGSTILKRNWITTNDLIYISQNHNLPLTKLTNGLTPYIPPPKTSSYTPEFQSQLNKLKYQLEEQEYQNLINKGHVDNDYQTPNEMAKELKNQLTTILNIFVSVCSVVYAIWYWTKNYQFNPAYRVLICLFFGILILVAEVVVFNSYLRKIENAKLKEANKIEKKTIIDTIIIKPKQR